MTISNRDIKRVARQIFASSRAIVTPFYNREKSKREVAELFQNIEALRGSVVLISAPMGTGKTFFIDQVTKEIGIHERAKPLLIGELKSESDLKREKGDVLFVDEGDIKTNWSDLNRGARVLGEHLREDGRVGLLLGDFVLRNDDLAKHLPSPRYLQTFEPVNRAFLEGVIRQRLDTYLNAGRGQDIVDPGLYDILVPDGTAFVNSFRAVLSFLENLVRTLPNDAKPCRLTVDLAKDFTRENFEPALTTDRQEDFLNRFLDFLAANHPGGSGLAPGFDRQQMFMLAKQCGYADWSSFQDEIVDPFGEQGLLLARGIPGLDEDGRFARWREPYYPSLPLMLTAEG